jgi:hypothetical protein
MKIAIRNKRVTFQLVVLTILAAVLFNGCVSGKKTRMTRFYVEYARGKSFPTYADLAIKYDNHGYKFHNLYLEDDSFFPDNSIIPKAFLEPLIKFKFNDALKAFTEPYYSYRFIYFLKSNPHIGIGYEFIHSKVFMLDKDQLVHMTGLYNGEPIDGMVRVGDYIDMFNVSHGINHVSLHLVYRWMLKKTEKINDGRWQPFVSLSGGPAIPHLELDTIDNGEVNKRAYSYQGGIRNWGIGAGAGIRFKPWRHLGFYMEYKFTYTNLQSMRFDDLEDTKVKMAFSTHHLQWGISLMF